MMVQLYRSLILWVVPFFVVGTITTTWTTRLCNIGAQKYVSALQLPFMISHNVLRKQPIKTRLSPITFLRTAKSMAKSYIASGSKIFMSQTNQIYNRRNEAIIDTCHDVVLFGIGDLRVDDHDGLIRAIQLQQQQQMCDTSTGSRSNVHCCFLCTDSVLSNVCGIVSHTVDIVNCIISAVRELDTLLQENYFHPLHCIMTTTGYDKDEELDIISYIQNHIILPLSSTEDSRNIKVRIHVCDLGPIDNEMAYGAYAQLLLQQQRYEDKVPFLSYDIVPWKSALRLEPWEQVQGTNFIKFPISYPDYAAQYCTTTDVVSKPQTLPTVDITTCVDKINNSLPRSNDSLPSTEKILGRLRYLLPNDHLMNDTTNTGLYGSHFGGIGSNNTVGCTSILQHLRTYCTTCNEDDATFFQYVQKGYDHTSLLIPQRNNRSLEHAAMIWQLDGGQNNWLDGEVMIRILLLPLYLGTISPRRIWHTAGRPRQSIVQISLWNPPPLRTLVEGREWHNLLAARHYYNAQNRPETTTSIDRTSTFTKYNYWRYHGLLCRYAQTDFTPHVDNIEQREGILLVHGFGASGSQWNKAMSALSNMTTTVCQGLAPDLIGFGHSEKPSVSYTSYLWDSQVMDFVKDVAIPRHRWRTFITGGNSIGGYTSMSFAACDAGMEKHITSSGSSGTGRCSGLVLMNSAGPTKTKHEIEQEIQKEDISASYSTSIAVATAALKLPTCKPPPRPVARLFGNALLSYLRPNIQSICRNLYPTNPAAVDDILVQDIERDSLDPGAINVMMAGAKLPPPRTSNELLGARFGGPSANQDGILESYFNGPVLIAQGVLDPLNNSTDRMNRFHSLRDGIDVAPIQAGHCPHDELPTEVAQSIANWMLQLKI